MICNGRAVSREEYGRICLKRSEPLSVKETGVTTFNLPDCRGVVVRGYDNGRGYDSSRVFGSYQADQIQSHTHGLPGAQSACAGGGRIIGVYNASDASATAGFSNFGRSVGSNRQRDPDEEYCA